MNVDLLKKISEIIKHLNADAMIIQHGDFFGSEFPLDDDNLLLSIVNFNGSSGMLIIFCDATAILIVDGRYTLQASALANDNLEIKSGKNARDIAVSIIKERSLKSVVLLEEISRSIDKNVFSAAGIHIYPYSMESFITLFPHKENGGMAVNCFSIISIKKKISIILDINKTDFLLLTDIRAVASLFNIRCFERKYSCIPDCFAFLSRKENPILFLRDNLDAGDIKTENFQVMRINNICGFLSSIREKVSIDIFSIPLKIKESIKSTKVVNMQAIWKILSVRTTEEIKSMESVHIRDGRAKTRFISALKSGQFAKIDEIEAIELLEGFRKEERGYISPSFPCISGFGENSAKIHYSPSKNNCSNIGQGIYLVDSGGQYLYGTTDVTRTIILNRNPSKDEKFSYTMVLKSHLALSTFVFKKDTHCAILDDVARKTLNEVNMNYAHGTGHGIGFLGNVHEPPSISPNSSDSLSSGMIVTNEPGFYSPGSCGYRLENVMVVNESVSEDLYLSDLTLVPFDPELIDLNLLSDSEKERLKNYSQKVFKTHKQSLSSEVEEEYLRYSCSFM